MVGTLSVVVLGLASLRIATTTSTLAALCREVAGDRATVVAVAPGGACPGHFDVGAREAMEVAEADVFMYQGWEPWLLEATVLREADDPQMLRVEGPKDLMVPPAHVAATKAVAELLAGVDPDASASYRARALDYCATIENEAARILERCREAATETLQTICSSWQEPLLQWMGYHVVATFGPPDQATVAGVAGLARQAQEVDLVVDNLQSGPPAGAALARDVGARHVVLTNFVLEGGYLDALQSNVAALLDAAGH
jgi:zinc transport system substrate-binding protein